ncbi:MAG: MBL fold metallo-hydrolase [Anaerolineales bacterium]|nr:MAG: MBL fold metallo-hydrolase [Anaerolineales bacterium]
MQQKATATIITLQVGELETNCYVVACPETREAAVIDPGGAAARILEALQEGGLTARFVLNTHCHFDHIGANARVVEATGAPLALHPLELPILEARGGDDWFGLQIDASPSPAIELDVGQVLEVGTLKIEVLHTPGHSPGGLTFYAEQAGAAFDGDLLFNNGVGRTDLPGGSWDTLIHSVREVLFNLPDETVIYPGHGPATTVGEEKRSNLFVKTATP